MKCPVCGSKDWRSWERAQPGHQHCCAVSQLLDGLSDEKSPSK